MKRIFIAIIVLMIFKATASAQVTMQPGIPAVGMIQKNQLWNILLVNATTRTYDCRLQLLLKDRQTGLELMTATTAQFSVPPGAKQLNINTIEPVQYNYLTGMANNNLQGLLTVGSYTACYLLTSLSKDNLSEECVQFDVEPLSPPLLIFPQDSSRLDVAPTQFSWIPPSPAGVFENLHYEVLITQIIDGQQANEALQQNVPFYSDGRSYTTNLNYSTSLPAFEKDKWYAWQVVAADDRNYTGKSETWVFKIGESKTARIIQGTAFVKMKTDGAEMAVAPNGILKIAYNNLSMDKTVKIEIADLSNQHSDKELPSFEANVKPGENLIQYNLKRIMQLSENSTYKTSIINSKGEKVSVLFKIKIFKD